MARTKQTKRDASLHSLPPKSTIAGEGEGSRKRRKTIKVRRSSSEEDLENLVSTSAISAKTNSVVTRILLDDARDGFKNGNFVCSPFSLETLLGMLAAGAEGKTLEQLLEFLGHETIDQVISQSPSAKLLAQILSNSNNGTGGSLDIGLANAIWVDKKLNGDVQSCYKEVLKTFYDTEPRFLDFRNKHESAKKINSWVNKKTRGLIPNIVDGGDLEDVVIALANALYFKGLWSDEPFDTEDTEEKDFHLMNGETVTVPFMTSYDEFKYGSFKGYQTLRIPYEREGQSNKFCMYLFLPDRKDGLQELLQVFHSNPALFHTKFDLHWTKLDELWIPKFKISNNFDFKKAMEQMGLTLPFKTMNMELNRILESRNSGDDMLYVSKILQKSFIEVDEKGTEAAGCTLATMRIGCAAQRTPPPPKPRFVADHPFMFMIREEASRAVFFIGVVLNPHATGP